MTQGNMGGMYFVIEGQAEAPREKVDDKTGEVKVSTTVKYFGGSQYIILGDPGQGKLFKNGDWLVVTADVREFRDNMFPDRATITKVNGKEVPKPADK